jgi:hypothetical protein
MAEFAEIKDFILYAMYTNAISHNVERWSINELVDQNLAENQFLARKAIESLEVNGMILRSSDSIAIVPMNDWNSRLEITGEGMDYVEHQAKLFGSTIYNASNSQAAKPRDNRSSEKVSVPASDRLVALDHNSDPYRNAIAALDEAYNAFRADHHLDNQFRPEKTALLATLDAGKALLNQTEVHVTVAVTTIISPLKALISRYQEAIVTGIVEAVARTAIERLIELAERAVTLVNTLLS